MKITKKYIVMQGQQVELWAYRFEKIVAICDTDELAEDYVNNKNKKDSKNKYFWFEEIDWVEE